MSKEEYIVIITEGEKTEKQIVENLQSVFFKKNDKKNQILLSFKTHIYELWRQLEKDEFETDIIEVLIERDKEIEKIFNKIDKNCISEKYLFFDYDGQACKRKIADSIIKQMIENFDNETENGKLYISYPMVEAIKHLKNGMSCNDICYVKGKENIHYKDIVSHNTNFSDLTKLNKKAWNTILNFGVKKANCLVSNNFSKPEYADYRQKINQENIFKYQLQKHINRGNNIAVLSGFPFFLIDYFGEKVYSDIKDDNYIKFSDSNRCSINI